MVTHSGGFDTCMYILYMCMSMYMVVSVHADRATAECHQPLTVGGVHTT